MSSSRREFVARVSGAAAVLGAAPSLLEAEPAPVLAPDGYDQSWVAKVNGKYKVVMDCAAPESGYGVLRATMWARQYVAHRGAKPGECSTVLILRHDAIVLAMNQACWAAYGLGAWKSVLHPVTEQPTVRNPALMTEKDDGLPAPMADMMLDRYIARGGITLACDLAFGDVIGRIAEKDKLSEDAARAKALTMLVPGVVLQPSGMYAAIRAQEVGCLYGRGS